jgi:hypothetical protein
LVCQAGWASAPMVVKDLRADWLQFSDGSYQPVERPDQAHIIYFHVKASLFKGQYLSISCPESCSLFVNGRLLSSGQEHLLSIDSIAKLYTQDLFFAVHHPGGLSDLSTRIVSPYSNLSEVIPGTLPRPPTFFRDYSIIVSSVLLLFLLILFRTNPQLTYDYFSFAKIFSVQERNENLLASRITSSVNLLFYLFCALLTGFLLSAVFYFAGFYFNTTKFYGITSLGSAFSAWLKLSLFVLALLASKLTIVLTFSSLFDFRETVSFQFFNFLRFVLFTAIVMAILSLFYFVFKGGQAVFYQWLIILGLVLLSVGSVMVLIKLLARASFSFFHLFSYLCASEIIPLVIIIKIFF